MRKNIAGNALSWITGFAFLLMVEVSSAGADVIVNWGGPYVSSNQPIQGHNSYFRGNVDADEDADEDDAIGGRRFDLATPMTPVSGYTGTSAVFYGGLITAHTNDTSVSVFDEAGIQNQGPNDEFHFHLSHSGHFHDAHMAVIWQQPDFANGGSPFIFDSASSATLVMGQSATESMQGAQARLLVRDANGDFWVSQDFFDSPQGTSDFYTWSGFTGSSDGLWASYNPLAAFPSTTDAGSDLRFDQSTAIFADKNFSSITGVGFYFEQDAFHNNLDFHFASFSVSGSTIPEPTAVGLLGGLTALSALRFRNRRRNGG